MRSKILLSTLFISALSVSSLAQVSPGIKAGAVFSTWRGDAVNSMSDLVQSTNGIVETQGKAGFYAGGFVEIPFGKTVSIEPGLTYSQKGYTLRGDYSIPKVDFLGLDASANVNSHYIDLPILIKVQPVKGLQLFAGPQFSYLAKSELKIDASALGFTFFNRTLDMTEEMNRFDIGLTGGIGYTFDNGFSVSAQYDHGLNKVDKNENFKAYNQAVKVGVGFKF